MKKKSIKRKLTLLLSAAIIGTAFCTAPAISVSAAASDDYPEIEIDRDKYVYDTQFLKLDPNYEDNTMSIIGYYGNEPYLIIPPKIEGFDVVSIGANAFYSNENIKGVLIPDSVQVVERYAFMYARQLEEVYIPSSVTSIGEGAFSFCDSLESIFLPDSITSIGEGAFNHTGLKSFTFPAGMDTVPDRCLEFNDSLTEINMHNGIKYVNNYAFWHCNAIETVSFPPSVRTIGESAIACCDNLKNVTLPPDLKIIPMGLAAECKLLESIEIPETVETIEKYAFYRCPAMKSLTVPATTREIGEYAIGYDEGVPDWTKVLVDGFVLRGTGNSAANAYADENNIPFDALEENCPYEYDIRYDYSTFGNDKVTITGYKGDKKDIVIPHYIEGRQVNKIADRAFEGKDITSLYVPGNVESIGEFAFNGCTSLKSVYLCDDIQSIEACAFESCTSLEDVRLPEDMTQWNEKHDGGQFSECTSLESIVLPAKLREVNPFTFSRCTSLKDIVFPERLDSIGHAAFDETAWLNSQPDGAVYIMNALYTFKDSYPHPTEINVKEETTYIAITAFANNENITSVILPQGLESIDMMAFFNCRNLKAVTIPESVTYIGENALGWNTDPYYPELAFIKTENFNITGKSGTAAEAYAKEHSFIFVDPSKPLVNKSTVSSTNITLGEKITLNAIAEGGTGPYTYALMFKKSTSSTWTKIGTKYGTASTGSFKPGKAVPYDIMINVKDATGKIKSKTFKVNVSSVLKNTSTISSDTVKVGEKVTLNGSALGGAAPYTYALMFKKSTSSTWTKIGTKYGTASTGSFKPGKAVPYDIMINVKDSTGKIKSKKFTLTVK